MFGKVDLEAKLRKKDQEAKQSTKKPSTHITHQYDDFIYGGGPSSVDKDSFLRQEEPKPSSIESKFKGFENVAEIDDPTPTKRRFDKWSAPQEFLDETAEIMGRTAEDPFEKTRVKRIADLENDYRARWRKRRLSPERDDPFSGKASSVKDNSNSETNNKRTYAEIYMETDLERQKSDLLFKLRKKEENDRHRRELEKKYGKEYVTKVMKEEEEEKQRKEEEDRRKRIKLDPSAERGRGGYGSRGSSGRNAGERQDEKKGSEDTEEPKEKVVLKEEPNFGLSGKLSETTHKTVKGAMLKWVEPAEARVPSGQRWRLYVMKDGKEIEKPILLYNQKAYRFGRERVVCDIPTDHESCSKQHAAICFRAVKPSKADDRSRYLMIENAERIIKPFLIDLSSTNGTKLNGQKIEDLRYYELRSEDLLQFGFSSREYILVNEDTLD